jgi:hypothetical protein
LFAWIGWIGIARARGARERESAKSETSRPAPLAAPGIVARAFPPCQRQRRKKRQGVPAGAEPLGPGGPNR